MSRVLSDDTAGADVTWEGLHEGPRALVLSELLEQQRPPSLEFTRRSIRALTNFRIHLSSPGSFRLDVSPDERLRLFSRSQAFDLGKYHARVLEGVAKSPFPYKGSCFQEWRARICALLKEFIPSNTLAWYGGWAAVRARCRV